MGGTWEIDVGEVIEKIHLITITIVWKLILRLDQDKG